MGWIAYNRVKTPIPANTAIKSFIYYPISFLTVANLLMLRSLQ
jgi:hypothetical protein